MVSRQRDGRLPLRTCVASIAALASLVAVACSASDGTAGGSGGSAGVAGSSASGGSAGVGGSSGSGAGGVAGTAGTAGIAGTSGSSATGGTGGLTDAAADAPTDATSDAPTCGLVDLTTGGAADPDRVYPTPRYQSYGSLGPRVAAVCVDSSALSEHATLDALAPSLFAPLGLASAPVGSCSCDWEIRFEASLPTLSGYAQATWAAAAQNAERYVLVSSSAAGRALTSIHAPNERAALHALYTAMALAQADGGGKPPRVAAATIVDYPALGTRAVLEGFYGAPYSSADRAAVIRLAARLKQTGFVYGPKADPYARKQWAAPYPAAQAQAIRDAADVARQHLVDFVWSVSPGLPFAALPPGNSIKYSSDVDFDRLTSKIESVRALGVSRFALFLDDLTGTLVWPEDTAAFPALVDGHAALINRLDDHLKSKDAASRLIVVGSEYTSFWPTWDAYNTRLGELIHPGIDVLWTGPGIYSTSISASDLTAIDQKLGREVSLWDNGPQTVAPLTGRAADLDTVIDGIYSNAVVNENGKFPTSDFFEVQGTLADYAWNPPDYAPNASFQRWLPLLLAYPPP